MKSKTDRQIAWSKFIFTSLGLIWPVVMIPVIYVGEISGEIFAVIYGMTIVGMFWGFAFRQLRTAIDWFQCDASLDPCTTNDFEGDDCESHVGGQFPLTNSLEK